MKLKNQVKKFVKFDIEKYDPRGICSSIAESIFVPQGAEQENERLAPLLNLLPEIVEALEKITYTDFRDDAHDIANQTLAKIKEVVVVLK